MSNNFLDNAGKIADILNDERSVQALYDHTRSIMWSVVEYKDMQMLYSCAIKEIKTKLEVLDSEFELKYKRNPISSISTRLKRTNSIVKKLTAKGQPFTMSSMTQHVNDIAGVRVICSYVDDIYTIAESLLRQDDVTLIEKKDYIMHPKENGYRSLHLIVSIPVFLSESTRQVKVEVQIRTIAMDCWATLEHQLRYKREIPDSEEISKELLLCANAMAETDARMLNLRRRIELAEDFEGADDLLLDRLSRLDII